MRRAARFRKMRDAGIRLPVSGEAAIVGGCCGRFSTALVIPEKDTGKLRPTGTVLHGPEKNFRLFKREGQEARQNNSINVSVVYIALDVMILMRATSIARATGRGGP